MNDAAKIAIIFNTPKFLGIIFTIMGKILSRIKEIADKEGITIGALERSIGASKGVLSRAIANDTDIQAKWLESIVENYPLYSTRWLLSGQGDMLNKQDRGEAAAHQSHEPQPAHPDSTIVAHLIDTIKEQAEEIGRLKARIAELERRRGDNVGDAQNSSIANVG